ncbi:MAG TPA: sarcosine oxidase subunit gamma family protein [Jiangellaceae bacterium]
MSELTITDCTDWTKVLVRAAPSSALAAALGTPYGRATRAADGALVVGTAPDGWLLLAPDAPAVSIVQRVATQAGPEFASIVDVTHGRALVRLSGTASRGVLAKVCAVDLADAAAPAGAAIRTLVAGITAMIVRDDEPGELSFLIESDRSYGEYLMDVLLDAGS